MSILLTLTAIIVGAIIVVLSILTVMIVSAIVVTHPEESIGVVVILFFGWIVGRALFEYLGWL